MNGNLCGIPVLRRSQGNGKSALLVYLLQQMASVIFPFLIAIMLPWQFFTRNLSIIGRRLLFHAEVVGDGSVS